MHRIVTRGLVSLSLSSTVRVPVLAKQIEIFGGASLSHGDLISLQRLEHSDSGGLK